MKTKWGYRTVKERIMKYNHNKNGYLYVCLQKEHTTKLCRINRLVAQTFISNPDNKEQVNHIDGNKENNIVTNLEWVSQSENMQHAYKTGLLTKESQEKAVDVYKDGEKITTFKSIMEAERILNIPNTNIVKVCKGKRHTAGGYTFRYAETNN